jgi:hypothetical protein
MAKAARGWLLLFVLASCGPMPVQPPPGTHPSAPSVPGAAGVPNQPQITGSQRGQYVWEKMMEGVHMGAFAGPYGAGAGLVLGALFGLFTADAHYTQLNAQIQTENTKNKELEDQLDQELERQRNLEVAMGTTGPTQTKVSVPPTSGQAASDVVGTTTDERTRKVDAQASLGKTDARPAPLPSGFKNVEVKDMNQDGVPDLWIYYNPANPGEIVRQEEDTNGDGRVDAWSAFSGGKLARREVDSLGRGRPNVVYLYEDGVIALEERDDQGKGRPTFRAHYQNGRLAKVEKDTDSDGKTDLSVYYDVSRDSEVVLKEERDLNGDGLVDLWSYYEDTRLARRDVSAAGLEVLSKMENRDLSLPSEVAETRMTKDVTAAAR